VVTCTRGDVLAGGNSYPSILLSVTVSNTATTVTNTATVSGGGDSNTSNNTATDPTDVLPPGPPRTTVDVSITKSHTGLFLPGQSQSFQLVVRNARGSIPTLGDVTVRDPVPAGLVPTSASGAGWSCGISEQLVTCTRSDVLQPGNAFPAITLNVT